MSTATTFTDKQDAFLKRKSESSKDEDMVFYSTFCETIPEEYKQCVEQILNETAESKIRGIRYLEDVLKSENQACPGEDFLVMILRGCKYDLKKSETKLKRMLSLRQEAANCLAKIEMEKIETIIDDILFGVLPYRDKFGRAIMFSRENHHFDQYKLEEVLHCCFVFYLFLLSFPMTSLCGISYINDCKTKSHLSYLQMVNDSRSFAFNLFVSLPVRFGRLDNIHELSLFRWMAKAFMMILPGKMYNRILFHGSDLQSLSKAYHPDLLPSDFGGNLGPINNACYRQRFLDFMKDFRSQKDNKMPK